MMRVLLFAVLGLVFSQPGFAGGASEVGNGHSRRSEVPAPSPQQKGGMPAGGAGALALQAGKATFNVDKAPAGTAVEARVPLLITGPGAHEVESCAGELLSDSLRLAVSFESCRIEGGVIVLGHRFRETTPARTYRVGEVSVKLKGRDTVLHALPVESTLLKVEQTRAIEPLKLERAWLEVRGGEVASGGASVAHDEVFALHLELRGAVTPLLAGELEVKSLDVAGPRYETLRLPTAEGYSELAIKDSVHVELRLVVPARFAAVQSLELGPLVLVDSNLSELSANIGLSAQVSRAPGTPFRAP